LFPDTSSLIDELKNVEYRYSSQTQTVKLSSVNALPANCANKLLSGIYGTDQIHIKDQFMEAAAMTTKHLVTAHNDFGDREVCTALMCWTGYLNLCCVSSDWL